MQDGPHRDLMLQAIAREAAAHRAALAGDREAAATGYREAAALYRRSWELAPPKSYGRLVGLLKAAVLGGSGADAAAYVRGQLAAEAAGEPSPTAGYVLAVAALVAGDDDAAVRFAGAMRGASEPHDRTANAIVAIARGDAASYRSAVAAIVEDFAARDEHLTGVPIADTAAMLEAIARERGLGAGLQDPLMPAESAGASTGAARRWSRARRTRRTRRSTELIGVTTGCAASRARRQSRSVWPSGTSHSMYSSGVAVVESMR